MAADQHIAVFFAFDDQNMPWHYRVRLQMCKPQKYAGNPILARGEAGSADSRRLQSCPVVHANGQYRMWYVARDDGAAAVAAGAAAPGKGAYADVADEVVHSYDTGRICYAESEDGYHWTRPNLGLVDYHGSTDNNICDIEPGSGNMDVLYQPDAEPERRYLMVMEFMGWRHKKGVGGLSGPSITRFAASPDGLTWTMLQDEPGVIQQHYEASCLYRFKNRYHLAGHQGPPMVYLPLQQHGSIWMCGPKIMSVWSSPDVDHWPTEACHAFSKPMQSSSPHRSGWDREENHLGAYVTTYQNVCLGVCGLWHHPITDAPPEHPDYIAEKVSVDLGLILSNDGVHFREPAPGFVFVGRDQELNWDRDYRDNTTNDHLIMMQGPMVNIGDRTVIYYAAFTPTGDRMEGRSNLGLATLPRDRFGYLTPVPDAPFGDVRSAPLRVTESASLYLNFEVDDGGSAQVALTDGNGLGELHGYRMNDCTPLTASGLRELVRWGEGDLLPGAPFCVRVRLKGPSRLYAVYLETGS